jgi:hypothetical protein
MKLLRRVFALMPLVIVFASCSAWRENSTMQPSFTPTSVLDLTASLEPTATASSLPRGTDMTPTQTAAVPVSITQTTIAMENGLSWIECVVPNRDYSLGREDMKILKECVDPFEGSEDDGLGMGERVKGNFGWDDLRITIGKDHYEARFVGQDPVYFHYELTKNGEVIYKTNASFTTYDPNQNLWIIDGKLVWELAGGQSRIIVNGVNFNEKYQLEGSYFPYEIKGKLIFVAKRNGKFSIMYDEKIVGPEFDQISMPYCCAMVPLIRGNGQYWFVGSREGKKFLVSIR